MVHYTDGGTSCRLQHRAVKELKPIVIAAALWGRESQGKSVLVQCDNAAVVNTINQGSSKNPKAMLYQIYLTVVRHLHIDEGYGDPYIHSMAKLEQVMKGIRSLQSNCLKTPSRLPITPELLLKLKEVWSKCSELRDGSMLWAAVTLCFFGFLRSAEIAVSADQHSMKGLN